MKIRNTMYVILASTALFFGGLAYLELKDRIGTSIINGAAYPVNKYGKSGKSTFYHPNTLTSIKLIDEDGNGTVDKKQITIGIPRAMCKFYEKPSLEDQVLFDKVLQAGKLK